MIDIIFFQAPTTSNSQDCLLLNEIENTVSLVSVEDIEVKSNHF
jgi:hypothetical protein